VQSGALISYESNTGVYMDAATEDATFIGVCAIAAPAAQDFVLVATRGVVEIDCTSGTYAQGSGLKYSAGSASADYSLVTDGSANTIMFVWKYYGVAVTRLRAIFDVIALGKLFTVSA
jgi:hypothetical protein